MDEHTLVIIDALLQTPGYICWKNTESIFIGGNFNFLKICGLQSLEALVGKTDFDMPWGKTHAEQYRKDDREVLQGRPKINYIETQIQYPDCLVKVIVNKVPLYDVQKNIVGIICHYYDLTCSPIPLPLPSLTLIQKTCLQHIGEGLSAKEIARKMNLSARTVESYTEILKNKLHCFNKAELIKKAILLGLIKLSEGC